MLTLDQMHEKCRQCGFDYARIDIERWNSSSSRRVMCPVCGWTCFEEYSWHDNSPSLNKRGESYGFGAYRLVPPGGYSGYNAFHAVPEPEVVNNVIELLTVKGWKGYLTLWDEKTKRPRLIAGSPLQRYEAALD
ncbi:MAG: hypothetical protein FIA91_08020 [Geobacter sp.]|nr:hypothetical protein [Geobacter sp.]